MRESISGTWLLGFVVLFIVLFSGFLAVSINYTKAFQDKNFIISTIENYEGYTDNERDPGYRKIQEYMNKNGKNINETDIRNKCQAEGMKFGKPNFCYKLIGDKNHGAHYKVTTFVKIELPLIWQSFLIPISGETKTLYYIKRGA